MRRGRLFWKYVIVIVVLVGGALLASGLVEIYFSYQENKAALVALQREKALGAASRIEVFIKRSRARSAGPPSPSSSLRRRLSSNAASTICGCSARCPPSPS